MKQIKIQTMKYERKTEKLFRKEEKEIVKKREREREREREHTHKEAGRYGETDGQTKIQ